MTSCYNWMSIYFIVCHQLHFRLYKMDNFGTLFHYGNFLEDLGWNLQKIGSELNPKLL